MNTAYEHSSNLNEGTEVKEVEGGSIPLVTRYGLLSSNILQELIVSRINAPDKLCSMISMASSMQYMEWCKGHNWMVESMNSNSMLVQWCGGIRVSVTKFALMIPGREVFSSPRWDFQTMLSSCTSVGTAIPYLV